MLQNEAPAAGGTATGAGIFSEAVTPREYLDRSADRNDDLGERLAVLSDIAGDMACSPAAIIGAEVAPWLQHEVARAWLTEKLCGHGVPAAVARNAVIPCRAIVERTAAQIAADGAPAGAIPVRATGGPIDDDYRLTLLAGDIVDAVIFDASDPDRFALRFGIAAWLGAVPPQGELAEPAPIWRTPLGWLRAGCRGLVLLTAVERERQALLAPLRFILAEDEQHAAELQRIVDLPPPGPRIFVTAGQLRRRA